MCVRAEYACVHLCKLTNVYSCAILPSFWLILNSSRHQITHALTHMHTLINKHTSMLKEAQQHPQLNLKVRTTTNVHYFVTQLKRHKYCLCKYLYFYYFLFLNYFQSIIAVLSLSPIVRHLFMFLVCPLSLR